jgi:hypothetical protein
MCWTCVYENIYILSAWDQVILSVVRCEEKRDCAHSAQASEGPSSHTSRACAHRARARAQSKLENPTHHSQCTPSTQSAPHKRVPAPTQQSMRAQSACARTVQTRESHPPLTVHPLRPPPHPPPTGMHICTPYIHKNAHHLYCRGNVQRRCAGLCRPRSDLLRQSSEPPRGPEGALQR